MSRNLLSLFLMVAVGLLSFAVLVSDPIPVIAQGPPPGCTSWSVTIDFEDGTLNNLTGNHFWLNLGYGPDQSGSYWLDGGSDFGSMDVYYPVSLLHDHFGTSISTTTYFVENVQYDLASNQGNNTVWYTEIHHEDVGAPPDYDTGYFTATNTSQIYTFSFTATNVYTFTQIWLGRTTSGEYHSIDNIIISGCATGFPEAGGSGEFCEYVADANFDSGEDWTLFNSTTITNSTLQVHQNALAAQELISITQTYESYLVTVRARSTEEDVLPLTVGIANSYTETDQYSVGFDPVGTSLYGFDRLKTIQVATGTVQTYTTVVKGPPLGTEKWFFLTGNGADIYGLTGILEVEFVCVEPFGESSACVDPSTTTFDLNHGVNYSTGLFSGDYGASQGWVGVLYEDIAGTGSETSYLARFQPQNIDNPFAFQGLYASSGLFGFGQDDYVTVEYMDPVIPANIAARVVYPNDSDPRFELWIDPGTGWVQNSLIVPTYDDIETVMDLDHSVATVIITPTTLITTPVKIALALGTTDSAVAVLDEYKLGFDRIDIYGCFSGDPLTGVCVLSDPDLDEDNGLPSSFYWSGTYEESEGQANLDAGEVIFQNVTPPQAATYQLNMIASGFYNDGPNCNFTIDVKDYASTLILSQQDVDCKIGLVQTYTLQIDLPADPVEFLIRQNAGTLTLDYICLSLPNAPDCLNPNPVFREGIYGYSGDFTMAGGKAIVERGKSIAAFGVDYGDVITDGYQLEIFAEPVADPVDVRIKDDSDPPDINTPGTIISSTTTITHIISFDLFPTGTGPAVWNNNNSTFASDLALSRYCITQILSSTVWYGGKTCDTLTNADFTDETTGWTVDNIAQIGGWVIFNTGGGSVAQTITSISPATQTISSTLYWIAASPATASLSGTAVISSSAGVYTITRSFGQSILGDEQFDQVPVAGDVAVTISGPAGLQLDYACLLPGDFTESGEPGSGEDIGANCAPPPRMVLSDTLYAWLPSIWIWESDTPTNLETISAYSAAWLRYIGCMLTDLMAMLEQKLNDILLWLKVLTLLQGVDAVASTISAISDLVALLEETIDDLISALTGPLATLAYILGVIALFLAALVGLIALVIGLIALLWAIPSEFWTNFTDALNDNSVILLPFPEDESHPLVTIIYGIQVFNQTVGETILFPLTIIAISIGSIYILLWTIRRFFRFTF